MKIHQTKEGDQLALCEMSDQHLTNHINLLLNTADAMKVLIKSKADSETITEIIYGVSRKQQIGVAKQKIKNIHNNLPEYIMEATLRSIDFSERLREVFDREKGSAKFDLPILLRIENLLED